MPQNTISEFAEDCCLRKLSSELYVFEGGRVDGERGRKNSLFDVAEGEFAENVGFSCVLQANTYIHNQGWLTAIGLQANNADSCLLLCMDSEERRRLGVHL